MEKESCQIKCIETDDGYRIEISGKDIKEKFWMLYPYFDERWRF